MSDDVKLLEVPDLAGTIKRDWPRLANRAAIAVAMPVLVALLAHATDLFTPVAQLGLPLDFLAVGPFPYEGKLIAFVVLLLVLGSFLAGERTPTFLLALSAGGVMWAGFIYTRLRWTKLFFDDYDPLLVDAPTAAAWLWAFLLLAAGLAFVMVEAALDTRGAQGKRELADAEADALAKLARQGMGLALGLGLAAAAVLGLAFWGVRPLLGAMPFHVSPVFVLFALGLLLVLGLVLAARRRDLSGGVEALLKPPQPVVSTPPVVATRPMAAAPEQAEPTGRGRFWKRMNGAERLVGVGAAVVLLAFLLPWRESRDTFDFWIDYGYSVFPGWFSVLAAGGSVLLYGLARDPVRRFLPPFLWFAAFLLVLSALMQASVGGRVAIGLPLALTSTLLSFGLSGVAAYMRRAPRQGGGP